MRGTARQQATAHAHAVAASQILDAQRVADDEARVAARYALIVEPDLAVLGATDRDRALVERNMASRAFVRDDQERIAGRPHLRPLHGSGVPMSVMLGQRAIVPCATRAPRLRASRSHHCASRARTPNRACNSATRLASPSARILEFPSAMRRPRLQLPLPPPPASRRRRWPWFAGALLLVIAVVAMIAVRREPNRADLVAQDVTKPTRAPVVIGHPEWPREQASEATTWQPATLRFADGSSAVLYPDRVRSAWGRTIKISVERFDRAGKPITGVRDMELVVDTPGRTFKAGFTEYAAGRYQSELRGDALAIGRTDVLLVASQSMRPNAPVAMATAVIAIDVVTGIRFTGPPIAHRDGGRLLVDIPITTKSAAHVTIRGELRAGGETLAELTGEADVAEGAGVVTLDAGSLIAADDPRASTLALADVTATTANDGSEHWTDFWRGSRRITDGGQP